MTSFSDYTEMSELWHDMSKKSMNGTMDKMTISMDMQKKFVKV